MPEIYFPPLYTFLFNPFLVLSSTKVTYVPEDDDEKEGDSRQTTHGFTPGDVFMVFEYVDYDLSGLLKCRDVVSEIENSIKQF